MSSVQPWMIVVGVLAGLLLGGAAVSGWWWKRLRRARHLIDRIESSRLLLGEQTSQARRQIERLRLEQGELGLTVERLRRKLASTGSSEWAEGPESILPLESCPPVTAPSPLAGFRPIDRPRRIDAAVTSSHPERARDRAADGDFAPTQIQDDDGPRSRGFMPTQWDKTD